MLARQLQDESDSGLVASSPPKRVFKRLRRVESIQTPTPLQRELNDLLGGSADADVEAGMVSGLIEDGVRTRQTKQLGFNPGALAQLSAAEKQFQSKALARARAVAAADGTALPKPTRVDRLSAEQRTKRLDLLMSQTNSYLEKLDSQIQQRATTDGAGAASSAVAAAAAASASGGGGDNRGFSWMKESMSYAEREYGTTIQPTLMTGGVLKDYQLVGLRWLLSLHKLKLNGILADGMPLHSCVDCGVNLIAFVSGV